MVKDAQKDFTYRMSQEEFFRYKKNWWISLNTSGRNAPMKLRSDFSEALTKMHRLHRESVRRATRTDIFLAIPRNGIRRLLHPVPHSGTIPGGAHKLKIVNYL